MLERDGVNRASREDRSAPKKSTPTSRFRSFRAKKRATNPPPRQSYDTRKVIMAASIPHSPPPLPHRRSRQVISLVVRGGSSSSSSRPASAASWRIRHDDDDEKSSRRTRALLRTYFEFEQQQQQCDDDASTVMNGKNNRDNNDAIIINAFVAGAQCANTMTTTTNCEDDDTDVHRIAGQHHVDAITTAMLSEEEEKYSMSSNKSYSPTILLSIVDNNREKTGTSSNHSQLQPTNNSSSSSFETALSKRTTPVDNTINNGDRVVEATMVSFNLSDIDHDIADVVVGGVPQSTPTIENVTPADEAALASISNIIITSVNEDESDIQHLSLTNEDQASSHPVAVSMTLSETVNAFSLNLSNIESNVDDDDDEIDNDDEKVESNYDADAEDVAETAYEIDYSTFLCLTEASSHYSREDVVSSSALPSPIPQNQHGVVVVGDDGDGDDDNNVVNGYNKWEEDRDSIDQMQPPSIDIDFDEWNVNGRTMKYPSLDILRQDVIDKRKEMYNDDYSLGEENNVCNNITEERGRVLDEWMSKIDSSECEGRVGESRNYAVVDQELRFPEEQHRLPMPFDFVRDISVELHDDLTRVDKDRKNTVSENTTNRRPNAPPKSPSFGSISSKEASIDVSLHSSSSLDGENENETLYSIDRSIHKSTLSECLAAVQDYLHDSSDIEDSSDIDSDTVEEEPICPFVKLFVNDRILDTSDEEPSPREQLVFKYPMYNGGIDDEVWLASDVDSDESGKSELEKTKSSLTALIDEITLLEDDTKMQHEYITSPSNGDFISQLDHLNSQIHGTDSSFDTSQLEMTDDESKPATNSTIRGNNMCMTRSDTTVQQLPPSSCDQSMDIPTSKMTAQKLYFFKQPKHTLSITHSNKPNLPVVQEDSSDNSLVDRPVSIPSPQSAKPINSSTSRPRMVRSVVVPSTKTTITATTTGSITPLRTQRIDTAVEFSNLQRSNTSNTSRLEQIASIKAKLHVETDLMDLVSVHDAPIPTPILRINELPNSTRTSARKCYFYQSPTSKKTRSTHAIVNEEHRSPPPSRFSFDTEIRKTSTDARVKLTYATPSLTHRETMALQKHIMRGTWQHKSKDSDTRRHGKERNGFSPSPLHSI
jgi:hypothetical protein